MSTSDLIRLALPALIGLPVVAAIVLRFTVGARARSVAVAFAAVHLALTVTLIALGLNDLQDDSAVSAAIKRQEKKLEPVFAPRFVPGDPMPDGKPSFSTAWDVLPIYATGSPAEPGEPPQRIKLGAAQFFIGL